MAEAPKHPFGEGLGEGFPEGFPKAFGEGRGGFLTPPSLASEPPSTIEPCRLPRRRTGALAAGLDLLRALIGLGGGRDCRRARLDRKAAIERQARERL